MKIVVIWFVAAMIQHQQVSMSNKRETNFALHDAKKKYRHMNRKNVWADNKH